MNANRRDTTPHRDEQRPQDAKRERDEDAERRQERHWRIAATQMAAPPTRRWRRSGTFGAS
jgi:hypothetical protein